MYFNFFLNNYQIFGSLILIFTTIYWYLKNNYEFWAKQGIKGPKAKFILGNGWEKIFTPMADLDMQWLNKFGKVYGLFYGLIPVLTVTHPEMIKQIMVKDFQTFTERRKLNAFHPILNLNLFHSNAEDWKRIRPLVSPSFTSGKLKKMLPLMRESLEVLLNSMKNFAENDNEINIKFHCSRFTCDVIARCAFATDINKTNNKLLDNLNGFLKADTLKSWSVQMMPLFVNNLLGIRFGSDEKYIEYLFDLIRHLMKERNNEINQKHNDLLQALIDAGKCSEQTHFNDWTDSHYINEDKEITLSENIKDKHLTENEILGQSFIFFLAGFETTATTLSYCLYLLALNHNIQENLFREINDAFDENGEIEYEKLYKLSYLDAVISETLRIFPPIVRLERTAAVDYELGELKLKKGQLIEVSTYAVHHCSDNYENPEEFRPERFLPQNRHLIKPYTFIPFGAGPRNCVGMRFALLELKLGIAHIIRKFRFLPTPKTELKINFTKVVRLCHVKSLILKIEKR